jgi:hypothetical protein
MQTFSRSRYRVWIRLYVYPSTWANYKFFKFRLNTKNWRLVMNKVIRWGYKVNAVYREVEERKSGQIIFSERLK